MNWLGLNTQKKEKYKLSFGQKSYKTKRKVQKVEWITCEDCKEEIQIDIRINLPIDKGKYQNTATATLHSCYIRKLEEDRKRFKQEIYNYSRKIEKSKEENGT